MCVAYCICTVCNECEARVGWGSGRPAHLDEAVEEAAVQVQRLPRAPHLVEQREHVLEPEAAVRLEQFGRVAEQRAHTHVEQKARALLHLQQSHQEELRARHTPLTVLYCTVLYSARSSTEGPEHTSARVLRHIVSYQMGRGQLFCLGTGRDGTHVPGAVRRSGRPVHQLKRVHRVASHC